MMVYHGRMEYWARLYLSPSMYWSLDRTCRQCSLRLTECKLESLCKVALPKRSSGCRSTRRHGDAARLERLRQHWCSSRNWLPDRKRRPFLRKGSLEESTTVLPRQSFCFQSIRRYEISAVLEHSYWWSRPRNRWLDYIWRRYSADSRYYLRPK